MRRLTASNIWACPMFMPRSISLPKQTRQRGSFERISEAYLLSVLKDLIEQFPFKFWAFTRTTARSTSTRRRPRCRYVSRPTDPLGNWRKSTHLSASAETGSGPAHAVGLLVSG